MPGKESSVAIVSFIKYFLLFYRRKIIKFFDNNFRFKVALTSELGSSYMAW